MRQTTHCFKPFIPEGFLAIGRSANGFSFVVFLVLVALGLSLGACFGGSPVAAEGDVVFAAEIDRARSDSKLSGNIDIFSINESGEDVLRLTTDGGSDFSPSWSPKKNAIAFISERKGTSALWLMDIDGKSKKQISPPGEIVTNFEWALNSDRIVVEIQKDGSHWLGLIDLELDTFIALTPPDQNVKIGNWSPDGEWIVYFSVKTGDQGIRRRNINGVNEIAVTTGPDSNPHWSPDGRFIAFNRLDEAGPIDLFVTDIDGKKVVNLTPDEFDKTQFEWAPDSKRIVFVGDSTENTEIYTIEPDGDNLKQITSNRATDAAPHWSRDGNFIIFISESAGDSSLYTMDKDGEKQKRITLTPYIFESDW
jgi:Tol biopolymer transport system component